MGHESTSQTPHSRRGQTLVEFALTLPILLLLMFGVIEFARIFQAWITLQNAARTGARYAVTGQWDPNVVARVLGYTPPAGLSAEGLRENVLNELVPCTTGYDAAFARHWGYDCEPGDDDDQGLRVDMARIPSVVDRARIGAAGLGLKKGDHYVGLHNKDGVEINTETVDENQAGWFHVWMCSSRLPLIAPTSPADAVPTRYQPSADRNLRRCDLLEVMPGQNQYDAGGPGDAVEIIVFFNHPLITPLGLVDYVQLQARRVMINESFRSTRVVNLPPQLALPTFTPSKTLPPTFTLPPSETPPATFTPTRTPSPEPSTTATATALPECEKIWIGIDDVRLIDNYLQIRVHNDNTSPVFITEASINWVKHILFQDMYASEARLVGRSRFWSGQSRYSPTFIDRTTAGWVDDPPEYLLRRFDALSVTTFQLRFSNGPLRLRDYYTTGQFGGSYLTLGRTWGGYYDGVTSPCKVTLPAIPTPTPSSLTPTRTPTPNCTNFSAQFISFETNAVVHFQVRNNDVALARLTAFSINWNTYGRTLSPITLDFVSVGGTNAFDPAAIIMWDGTDNTPPASGQVGGTGWQITPVLQPGQILDIWFDFDGTSGRLDTGLGYAPSDFNDTWFQVDFICTRQPPDIATPQNTPVPTMTFTPSITPTASKTNTPGPTKTPTPVTPSKTPTPVTPSKTPTKVPTTAVATIPGGVE